jgi:hypothetical protein
VLGFLIFFSLVGVVVFSILCVFAIKNSLTVEFIKKHNRSSSNRHPRAKLAFFFRCAPILSLGFIKRSEHSPSTLKKHCGDVSQRNGKDICFKNEVI